MELLSLAHLLGMSFDKLQQFLHFRFLHTSGRIFLHYLAELAQTQLQVMEVGDGLAQLLGNIHEHLLEITESQSCKIGILRCHSLIGLGIGDEDHHAPVAAFSILPISLAALGFQEMKHLAVNILLTTLLQLLADVRCYHLDIVLQHLHIGEDGIVDTLEHIIGFVGLCGINLQGVVDESVAQRTDLLHGSFHLEMTENLFVVNCLHVRLFI